MRLLLRIFVMPMLVIAWAFSFCKAQHDVDAIAEINRHRAKQLEEFKDPEQSPLSKGDRKKLKDLNYFTIDLKYRVKAKFVKNEAPVLFKMKTSTTRLPEYVKYGDVVFTLDGITYKLELYQNAEISQREGFADYLFIPFNDTTNGDETYDGSRYIDVRIPTTDEITVDFNLSYNPYCAYGQAYSCPVPPAANTLPIAIKAGEKKFKAGH